MILRVGRRALLYGVVSFLLVLGLYVLAARAGYTVFHVFVEIFCFLIGFSIFLIGWNARKFIDNHYLLVVSAAFLFVSAFGVLHMLTYKGMNLLPMYDGFNPPTQLWIAMRYMLSLSLLMAPLFIRKKISLGPLVLVYGVIFAVLAWSILIERNFPSCLVAGQGLTTFKIVSEYIISAVFIASLIALYMSRSHFEPIVLRFIASGIILAICAELIFTLYTTPFDPANFAGHVLIIFSYYCFYKAIVETGMRKPYDLLFHNLAKSESQMRTVLDMLPVGVWLADEKGQIVFANPGAKKIWGEAPHVGVEGYETYKAWRKDTGKRIIADEWPINRAIQDGETTLNEIIDIETFNGTKKIVSNSAVPVQTEDGKVFGAVITNEDITERYQAEESLRESEERFRGIYDQATIGIAVADMDLHYTMANQYLLDMLGYELDELSLISARDLTHPDDLPETQKFLEQVLSGKTNSYATEKRYICKNGEIIWVAVNAAAVHDQHGAVKNFIIIVEDITERKNSQENLRALTETLEQRVAERTALAEQRTEQIRNLATALNNAEQQERQRLAKILHDHMQQLLVAARMGISRVQRRIDGSAESDILAHVSDLLMQAVQSSRSLSIQLCPPVLAEKGLAAALHWLGAQMQENHGLSVSINVEPEAEQRAQSLGSPIYQAVRELLFNIVKHAGTDRATVELSCMEDDSVQVVVEDRGKGFESDASENNLTSSGFGLHSIQKRIMLEGGTFQIESAPGNGTRIIIILQCAPSLSNVTAD